MTPSPVSFPRWRLLALVLATALGVCGPLFAKYAETSFSPLTMTLLRAWLATLILLPITLLMVPGGLHWRRFLRSLPVSLGYCGNIIFFPIGIATTTALASQLLYLLVPVLVLVASRFLFAEALTRYKLLGTALGISGAALVVAGSVKGNVADSLGTPFGNGFILLAVFSWAAFLLASRAQSQAFHPLEISTYALLTASLLVPFLALPDILHHHALVGPLTWVGIGGTLAMALLVSIARDITFQWGIKGSSAFIASALGFGGPVLTVAYAIPLLGEKLTSNLLFSGLLTMLGIFFAVILPAWQAHRKQQLLSPAHASGSLALQAAPAGWKPALQAPNPAPAPPGTAAVQAAPAEESPALEACAVSADEEGAAQA